MKNNTMKYISKIGQNTGTSKKEKNVIIMAIIVPLAHANQNLNSGSLLAKGLNSLPSLSVVGRESPEEDNSDGSSNGVKKAMKLFNRKIPNP